MGIVQLNEMTPSQRSAFTDITNGPDNVFLTGAAGTGKSRLLQELVHEYRAQGVGVGVTASTGIAAQGIGGRTLHSFCSIGTCASMLEWQMLDRPLRVACERKLAGTLSQIRVLIIDEVSMLEARMISFLSELFSKVLHDPRPFGGKRIILVGDLLQIPPVCAKGRLPDWAFRAPEFPTKVHYLKEVVRQGHAADQELLEDLRWGDRTERVAAFFAQARSRQLQDAVILGTHNDFVDGENARNLHQLPGAAKTYRGHIHQLGPQRVEWRDVPCAEFLDLKLRAPVVILVNDPDGAFVNGSRGIVVTLNSDWVAVDLGGRVVEIEPHTWDIDDGIGNKIGSVRAMPLKLGWALTVHKSQGMTLDAAQLYLDRAFCSGQVYVAASRVKDLRNVQLVGGEPRLVPVCGEVARYMQKIGGGR